MTDNINPSHYKDGPFECIELSRLLSSDWGQAVQYSLPIHKTRRNTMVTNVSEKDKTLNEIIDWVKSRCHEAGLSRFDVRRKSDRDFYDGQVNAFHEMLELCRSMLGYSGTMPSEVPNQSEDAKK